MAKVKVSDAWVANVEGRILRFARKHSHAYARKKREQSAIFEIGCFLALVDDYKKQKFTLRDENLDENGAFRYLTSPNGNPANFSYVTVLRYPRDLRS